MQHNLELTKKRIQAVKHLQAILLFSIMVPVVIPTMILWWTGFDTLELLTAFRFVFAILGALLITELKMV